MAVGFTHYTSISREYCVTYYGLLPEYVTVLRLLRPHIERQLPEVRVSISVNDDLMYLLAGEDRVVPFSQMPEKKNMYAYIRQVGVVTDGPHPLAALMRESGLGYEPPPRVEGSTVCLICPDSGLPHRCVEDADRFRSLAAARGFHPVVVGSDVHTGGRRADVRPTGADKLALVRTAGWVIGTENEYLYEAAGRGIKTTLLDTGGSQDLYRLLCPHGDLVPVKQIHTTFTRIAGR